MTNGERAVARRATKYGYFEEYGCGCVSDVEKSQRNLLGYCPTHGNDRRAVYPAPLPGNTKKETK